MRRPEHEKLVVYGRALEAARRLESVAMAIPFPHIGLREQLRRASTSIVLNIAEGAGEFSAAEKSRFYRIARRSAAECLAVLDLVAIVVARAPDATAARENLLDVSAMLTALIKATGSR